MRNKLLQRTVLCAAVLSVLCLSACGQDVQEGETSAAEPPKEEMQEYPQYYTVDGYAAEVLYPMEASMLAYAGDYFREIYDTYLDGKTGAVYFSIIPDKNYFLSEKGGVPAIAYSDFVDILCEETPYMTYIDIFDSLSVEDYYRTDMHWRQENLLPVANTIAAAMGVVLTEEYVPITLETPFIGQYSKEVDSVPEPDSLMYLSSEAMEHYQVTGYAAGIAKEGTIYDLDKVTGKDPYDLFLSGPDPLQIIENSEASTDRSLIIFRDSFASSLTPLLCEAYKEIILIDLRYIRASVIGDYVDFHGQDVLFLYSTHVLNNSMIMH